MAANPLQFPKKTLDIEIFTSDGAPTVKCSGRLIAETADMLKTEVKKLIAANKRVNVDLGNVEYMDSSALGTLVGLYVSARSAGCELKLIKLSDRVADLLRITKVASVFEAYGGYL